MATDGQNRRVDQVEGDLVYKIIGAAMAVLNDIGHGYREKTYERGLAVELRHIGLKCDTQRVYPIYYRGVAIDELIPDLEVERKVIVEAKVVERIIDDHVRPGHQLLESHGHGSGRHSQLRPSHS